MKLSDGVEWSLHCVALLASLPAGATLSNAALAEYHGVSESYLVKHLKQLAKAGILESVPGPRGGFRLARPASSITLLEVTEAVEGPGPFFRCAEIRGNLPCCSSTVFVRPCEINVAMLRAERAWREALRSVTVQGIVEQVAASASPERQAASRRWLEAHLRGV
ncbi:Rrf2 family protein [Deinobacterium chartae]|uniref:Rrf2 family protein n=1 Tax=Deinobacterium chartae TaxID=521158 RepID=A0A841I635_9DEIO|nr:Rrf2 family transcriptional regulator [Deinobacterium chartae]MBB6099890.1 Rrf2 family protein [Deinobacterium chartae]